MSKQTRPMNDEELRVFLKDKLESKCYRFFDDPSGTNKTLDELMQLVKSRDQQIALEAQIEELYSIITPMWGDKNWGQKDEYVLNLKGHDILGRIEELEATLKQAQEKE